MLSKLFEFLLDFPQALSKNGKVFGSGVMVGVQQCVDKVIALCSNYNCVYVESFLLLQAVMSASGAAATTSTATPVTHVLPKQTTIRPLTAAYQAASSGHEVCCVAGDVFDAVVPASWLRPILILLKRALEFFLVQWNICLAGRICIILSRTHSSSRTQCSLL